MGDVSTVSTPTATRAGGGGQAARLRALWERLAPLPGGKLVFSKLLGRVARYTGSIGLRVEEIAPGYSRLTMRDRRRLRNHLRSLHAAALFNLAEATSALAMGPGLPEDARAIVTHISIDYLKKARGRITSEGRCELPQSNERREYEVHCVLTDASGEQVARATARWLIGPV